LDRTNELEEQVQKLTGEVDEMRVRMARLEIGEPSHQNGTEPKSRRGFLKFGAGAVVGALGMAAAKVIPASAATNGNFILGAANAAGLPTTLAGDTTAAAGGPNPVLKVSSVGTSASLLATALPPGGLNGAVQALGADGTTTGQFEGIDAFATGATAWAVYGLTDTGTGVVGESNTGIGLYARRSGRIRQEGLSAVGAPSYTPNPFEQVRDANGVLYIHGLAGAGQAKWRRVNSLRTDAADGSGNPFKPFRLADTRNGTGLVTGPIAGGTTVVFTVAPAGTGASTIPADAIAVVGNLTAVGWNVSGWLTIFPAGVAYNPNADPSSMNFSGGAYAWANSFVVGLGTGVTWGGKVAVYVGTLGGGSTNFILDITGYIQ
jgi:hypothetical protein